MTCFCSIFNYRKDRRKILYSESEEFRASQKHMVLHDSHSPTTPLASDLPEPHYHLDLRTAVLITNNSTLSKERKKK